MNNHDHSNPSLKWLGPWWLWISAISVILTVAVRFSIS